MIDNEFLIDATTRIVTAQIGRQMTDASEVPDLIRNIHGALAGLGDRPTAPPAAEPVPAVPVNRSIRPDHIVCLEDGRKLKTLKRHLARLGMTPDQYRAKWRLPVDYPMVAPDYAEKRRTLAKATGLGHHRKAA